MPLVCNVTQWAHRMRCICGGMRGRWRGGGGFMSPHSILVCGSAQQMGSYFSHVDLFLPQMNQKEAYRHHRQVVGKAAVHAEQTIALTLVKD